MRKFPTTNPRLHPQRFLLTDKAFRHCYNHSKHYWQHDFPVSVETTTTIRYLCGNYHKHVHLQSLRRSAEAGSSLWQRTESSAFSVTIHHWAVACGDKLKSLHFSLDVFVESSSASPRGNLLWFAFIPNVVSAHCNLLSSCRSCAKPTLILVGNGKGGGGQNLRHTDIKFELQINKVKEQKLSERMEFLYFFSLRLPLGC